MVRVFSLFRCYVDMPMCIVFDMNYACVLTKRTYCTKLQRIHDIVCIIIYLTHTHIHNAETRPKYELCDFHHVAQLQHVLRLMYVLQNKPYRFPHICFHVQNGNFNSSQTSQFVLVWLENIDFLSTILPLPVHMVHVFQQQYEQKLESFFCCF